VEPFPVDPDHDRNQRFERTDVAIVMTVKAQMVVEAVERKGRFDGDWGQAAGSLRREGVAS
jgi:hypothetical protein